MQQSHKCLIWSTTWSLSSNYLIVSRTNRIQSLASSCTTKEVKTTLAILATQKPGLPAKQPYHSNYFLRNGSGRSEWTPLLKRHLKYTIMLPTLVHLITIWKMLLLSHLCEGSLQFQYHLVLPLPLPLLLLALSTLKLFLIIKKRSKFLFFFKFTPSWTIFISKFPFFLPTKILCMFVFFFSFFVDPPFLFPLGGFENGSENSHWIIIMDTTDLQNIHIYWSLLCF